jgi:hypothetical protein
VVPGLISWLYPVYYRCDENLRICFKMVRGINQLMFYLVRSTMVVICAWLESTYTKKFATQILSCSRQSPTNVSRTAGKLFADCAFEVSEGIYPPEISSGSIVVFVKDRLFLTRLLKPGSTFTLQRSNAYSISLQSTAATRGSLKRRNTLSSPL